MTQRKPLKEPTVKEKKLIKGIVEGKTKRQAGVDAGYTGKTIETIGSTVSDVLRKPNVQEALAAAFERHGITIDAATKPIADGLKAEKVQIMGSGEDAFADLIPDHAIRLKASGMAFGLMGIGKQSGDVTINFINHAAAQKDTYNL